MSDLVPIVEGELVEDPSGYGFLEPEFLTIKDRRGKVTGWVRASAFRGDPENVTAPAKIGRSKPDALREPQNAFPKRSEVDFRALPRPARELLLALWGLTGGIPYESGQAALAAAIGSSERTVRRNLAVLVAAGMVREQQHRGIGEPDRLLLHPATGSFALAETVSPSRARYERKAQPAVRLRLDGDHALVRCASVRRPDGSRFLSVPYLLDLLSERERDALAATALAGAPLCDDPGLANDLLAYFERQVRRERFRAAELARAAILRDARMRDDVPGVRGRLG
jgi:hypothetical protein